MSGEITLFVKAPWYPLPVPGTRCAEENYLTQV
jgi:hypothetical protein